MVFDGSTRGLAITALAVAPIASPNTTYIVNLPSSFVTGAGSGISQQEVSEGSTRINVKILNIGSSNRILPLIYAGLGAMRIVQPESASASIADFRPFSFGLRSDSLPKSGQSTYRGIVFGEAVSMARGSVFELTGDISISYDFSTNSYTGSVTLKGTDRASGRAMTFESLKITSPNPRSDNVIIGDVNAEGRIQAYFAGPACEEMYGIIAVSGADSENPSSLYKLKLSLALKR